MGLSLVCCLVLLLFFSLLFFILFFFFIFFFFFQAEDGIRDADVTGVQTCALPISFLEREYCVQYHETDFEFISRLLAEEGISYYFSHSDKKHELNFVNNVQDFFEAISTPLDFVGDSNQPNKDSISSWQRDFSYQTGGQ